MHRLFLLIASCSAALAVILGAFGAHALEKYVEPKYVSTFDTGVRYQFYHTFALFITAILYSRIPSRMIDWAGYSFIIGIILFSGSLYLLTYFKATHTVGLSKFGLITPVGGLFFIAGWLFLFIGILRSNFNNVQ